MIAWFKKDVHRKYIYRVFAALSLIAVGKGWFSDVDSTLYLGFIATALGFTLADANTGNKREDATHADAAE